VYHRGIAPSGVPFQKDTVCSGMDFQMAKDDRTAIDQEKRKAKSKK
jgi:hypothetical protein